MWNQFFKVVKIVPGRVKTRRYGTLDFSDPDLPVETLKKLYEEDFIYLEITEKGKEELYGIKPPVTPDPEENQNEEPENKEPEKQDSESIEPVAKPEPSTPPKKKNTKKKKPPKHS